MSNTCPTCGSDEREVRRYVDGSWRSNGDCLDPWHDTLMDTQQKSDYTPAQLERMRLAVEGGYDTDAGKLRMAAAVIDEKYPGDTDDEAQRDLFKIAERLDTPPVSCEEVRDALRITGPDEDGAYWLHATSPSGNRAGWQLAGRGTPIGDKVLAGVSAAVRERDTLRAERDELAAAFVGLWEADERYDLIRHVSNPGSANMRAARTRRTDALESTRELYDRIREEAVK